MSVNFVTFDKINLKNIKFGKPDPKNMTAKGQKISYFEIPISYNYGTEKTPQTDILRIEGPEMQCPWGISKFQDDENQKSNFNLGFSMKTKNNEDHAKMCDVLTAFYDLCTRAVQDNRMQIGKSKFVAENAQAMSFSDLVKYGKTEGVPDTTKDPYFSAKLMQVGVYKDGKKYGMDTLISDIDGNKVVAENLADVEFKMIPVIQFDNIFVGQKITIRTKLYQGLLATMPQKKNSVSIQQATIERLRQQRQKAPEGPPVTEGGESSGSEVNEQETTAETSTSEPKSKGPRDEISRMIDLSKKTSSVKK